MQVKVILNDKISDDHLEFSSVEDDYDHVWVLVHGNKVCVSIEELRLAIRKMTAK